MARLTANTKKWITVVSMVLLAAANITQPIDLRGMLPTFLTQPCCGQFSLVNIAAFIVLLCAYWVATRQTD